MDNMLESMNLPKRIVDDVEKFLRKLLGPSITEAGELIADQIRFIRFKNQISIFSKAKTLLEKKSIEPKQINLKLLSPLIEYSSLEGEENIQSIWANVIANVSSYDTEQTFNLKCIDILKEITSDEIKLLDHLFTKFEKDEKVKLEEWKNSSWFKNRVSVFPDNTIFPYWEYQEVLGMSSHQLDMYIDRLISFGILKYEEPSLSKSQHPTTIHDSFTGMIQNVEVNAYELETSQRVHFTTFGLYFVKLCKY